MFNERLHEREKMDGINKEYNDEITFYVYHTEKEMQCREEERRVCLRDDKACIFRDA